MQLDRVPNENYPSAIDVRVTIACELCGWQYAEVTRYSVTTGTERHVFEAIRHERVTHGRLR